MSIGISGCGGPETADAPGTAAAGDTTAPSTPGGLTASVVSPSQINLGWTASTDNVGVAGYRVFRNGVLVATLGVVTNYSDSGLTASTVYSYTVQAVDGAGNLSGQSAAASATTPAPDTTPPTVPSGLIASAASASQISLNWTASTDNVAVTGYRVFRDGVAVVTLGNVTAYTDSGLTASTLYSYTVLAIDSSGNLSAQSTASSATTLAPSNVIPISLAASRTSGVAPLAVFFDATGTTSPLTTRPFHELEYRWDFGDPAGGATWNMGSRAGVSSKNAATGPVAAHVFETTGTYTVTLTVTDGTNTDTATVAINVDNPDDVFAAANTVCISATSLPIGGMGGCPAGADGIQQANFNTAVSSSINAGKRRLLFKRGDTFNSTSEVFLAVTGPGIIGAFGSGAKPVITGAGHNKIVLGNNTNHGFGDWRIVDLDLDGVSGGGDISGFFPAGAATQITIMNCVVRRMHNGINMSLFMLDAINTSSQLAPIWNQWAIVGNQFTTNDQYAFLGTMNRSAILGNLVSGQAGQHAMRLVHGSKNVISNNELTGTANGTALTVRGLAWDVANRSEGNQYTLPANSYSEMSVVSDNRLTAGPGALAFTYASPNANEHPRFRNHIVERNLIVSSSAGQALNTAAGLSTIRNNLIINNGTVDLRSIEVQLTEDPAINQYFVYNNSVYSGAVTSTAAFSIVDINFGSVNLVARNNLGVAPNNTNGQTAPVRDFGGGGFTASNNSTTAQIQGPSPLTTTPPTQPSHWRPQAGSYPINGGAAVPVFSDFFVAPRTGNHIGAVNP